MMLYVVGLRKMTLNKGKVEGRLIRTNITDQYADFGSQAYAPLTRVGVFLDCNSEQFVVHNRYLDTYQGSTLSDTHLNHSVNTNVY